MMDSADSDAGMLAKMTTRKTHVTRSDRHGQTDLATAHQQNYVLTDWLTKF